MADLDGVVRVGEGEKTRVVGVDMGDEVLEWGTGFCCIMYYRGYAARRGGAGALCMIADAAFVSRLAKRAVVDGFIRSSLSGDCWFDRQSVIGGCRAMQYEIKSIKSGIYVSNQG